MDQRTVQTVSERDFHRLATVATGELPAAARLKTSHGPAPESATATQAGAELPETLQLDNHIPGTRPLWRRFVIESR